ncbi:glycosyltransferase family 4 protein [Azospirillum sp. SYSU D00513]|uniref:glycosyltransferase family 4 protein n=1 Tax=Azospirillum sp. SYSU D00513 TaxID=2812561 RepID=UPI001A96D52C|nr:glycosyltransferase family 4 protein [Azospirillum sp. SYSU D00513]
MHIGIIANEFPPDFGGMQEHAAGVVANLARSHRVTAVVPPGGGIDLAGVAVVDRLASQMEPNRRLLRSLPVDAWLALNAGLAVYAGSLHAPLFAYVHGNDFLSPWLPKPPHLVGRARNGLSRLPAARPFVTSLGTRWRQRLIGQGLRAALHVFANSGYTRRRCIASFGLPETSVEVVPPGIDARHLRRMERRESNRLRVLTVARLARSNSRKNVEGVIRAVALLKDGLPVDATIVGSGDDRERLEALAADLGLGGRVRFAGRVDADRLRDLYGEADVFVLPVRPSDTDVEGFGMVYIEAAAAGLPSIATASGGIPEAVRDGETGILLPDHTPEAVAAGLRRFAAERAAFRPEALRAFAESCLSDRTTDRLKARIEELTARHAAAQGTRARLSA